MHYRQQREGEKNDLTRNLSYWAGYVVGYIKRQHKAHQSHNKQEESVDRYSKRTANATLAIAFFTLVLTLVSVFQWCALKETINHSDRHFEEERRPWVSFNSTDKSSVSQEPIFPYETKGIVLRYVLSNSGHSPANIEIWGRIVRHGEYPNLTSYTKKLCEDGSKDFTEHPRTWMVIPGTPMTYDVHYDGGVSDTNMEHMPAPDSDAIKSGELSNIGCIVYHSTIGDNTPRHTPFIAQIHIVGGEVSVSDVLMIGRAD